MDHMRILKRAWSILWSYRVLWVFGFLLAITSGGSGGGNAGNSGYRFDNNNGFQRPGFPGDFRGLERFFERLFSADMVGTWIAIAVALVCLALLLGVLARIVYYVSHVALIRMVDEHERSGQKLGFRQGWRLGWSRAAWRLFLIDVLIYLPVFVLVLGLLGYGALFLFTSGVLQGDEPSGMGILTLLAGGLAAGGLIFVASILVSLVQPIIRRYAVLENAGVLAALRGGWALIRRRLTDVFLLWLILVGLAIAYTIVLIPVILLLLLVAGMLGGGLGLAGYFAAASAGEGAAIATALLLGLPVFLLTLLIPASFIEGLRQVYGSSVWTLAYRDLTQAPVLEALTPAPQPDAAPQPAAPQPAAPQPGAEIF